MRRAQAAVEFLMTYGWALMGILLVVSVIVYFGVIDPNMFVPERCELGYRLDCKDYIVTKSTTPPSVSFLAVNNFPEGIYIKNVAVNHTKFAIACTKSFIYPDGGILVGEIKTISVDCGELTKITSSKKTSFDIIITYYMNGTGNDATAPRFPLYGEIYTRVS